MSLHCLAVSILSKLKGPPQSPVASSNANDLDLLKELSQGQVSAEGSTAP